MWVLKSSLKTQLNVLQIVRPWLSLREKPLNNKFISEI